MIHVITLVRIVSSALTIILGLGIMATDNGFWAHIFGVLLFAAGGSGLQELVQGWKWIP
jgi:hypothetical protein